MRPEDFPTLEALWEHQAAEERRDQARELGRELAKVNGARRSHEQDVLIASEQRPQVGPDGKTRRTVAKYVNGKKVWGKGPETRKAWGALDPKGEETWRP